MYGITNGWTLKHKTPAIWNLKERHTAENLAVQLQDGCEHYKINNLVTTTDNALRIDKTLSLMGGQGFHILHIA